MGSNIQKEKEVNGFQVVPVREMGTKYYQDIESEVKLTMAWIVTAFFR